MAEIVLPAKPPAEDVIVDAPVEAPEPLPLFRRLDELHREPPLYRLLWLGVAAVVVTLFGWMAFTFFAPAHGGVDQNGYLVGGRMFAQSFSTRFVQKTPYEHVGSMWIMTSDGVYYPKYPLGLPILYAIPFWIGGEGFAAKWAFAVSPISATAAVAGMFFIGRLLAGSFAGLLGAILLGCSQVVLVLMNNANSHASCLAFAVWGMYLLLRWWQTDTIWRGVLAGLLLGYACLIRYTEGLLVLPIILAAACSVYWKNWRSYLRAAVPALAWLVPVLYLVIFNKLAMGTWTGYDSTNESHGDAFKWSTFTETWEQVVRTYNDIGMFFTLPLGIAGLGLIFRYNWRIGVTLLLWLIPGTLVYTAYYWSPERGIGYARFFVTYFPALCLGAAILARYGLAGASGNAWRRSVAAPIVAGVLVAIAAGIGVYRASIGLMYYTGSGYVVQGSESLAGLHRNHLSLAQAGQYIRRHVPKGSVLVVSDTRIMDNIPNYVQFIGDWEVYTSNAFSLTARRILANRREADAENPHPLQPARTAYIKRVDAGKDEMSFRNTQQQIFEDRLKNGGSMFIVGTPLMSNAYVKDHLSRLVYDTKVVARWHDQIEPMLGQVPDENAGTPPTRRWERGPRQPGPGGPGGRGFRDPQPSPWQLIEVKLKDAPSTRPVVYQQPAP